MHTLTAYAIGVAVIGFIVYTVLDAASKYSAKHNPRGLPGPALLPWIGRIHDLPIEFMWLKFKEWADIYGPIYRTKMLGDNFIIITDEKIAEEILIKRAKVYSDRPEIKSLFDAKSTHGSMEYLPLMGKNRKILNHARDGTCLHLDRILGTSAQIHPCLSYRVHQRPVQRYHGVRGQAMAISPRREPRRLCIFA
jgi:hypothetical protein